MFSSLLFYAALNFFLFSVLSFIVFSSFVSSNFNFRDQAEEVTNKGVPLRKDFESEEKQRRAAEREGRRTRRRRLREISVQPKHYEGSYTFFMDSSM